jgi:hypothetical protein
MLTGRHPSDFRCVDVITCYNFRMKIALRRIGNSLGDESAVKLRQSAPFVGLLPREEVRKLNEEAAG